MPIPAPANICLCKGEQYQQERFTACLLSPNLNHEYFTTWWLGISSGRGGGGRCGRMEGEGENGFKYLWEEEFNYCLPYFAWVS